MVEIHDLHVRFHGASREAVAGIDLTIRDGEVVGLVGESGSGKTVTAMTLSGLIERKKVTLSGEVRFDGRDILRLPRAELRAIQGRELGVVFQEPMTAMDPLMRIGPQVEEALAVHTQLTKEQRRARALEALRDVDLPAPEEIYRKYPHECSGGQLQRVMIAAAIVTDPHLLLLDEPTTALDVTVQAQILALLRLSLIHISPSSPTSPATSSRSPCVSAPARKSAWSGSTTSVCLSSRSRTWRRTAPTPCRS